MLEISIDGDACPVADAVRRVARRHGLVVHLVRKRWHRGPDNPLVRKVVVAEGANAADDWIAAQLGPEDIVVTADLPLAARCLDRNARVRAPNGRPVTAASIGMALAMRDLTAHRRETGERVGGPRPFATQDRSRLLSALEEAIQVIRRGR